MAPPMSPMGIPCFRMPYLDDIKENKKHHVWEVFTEGLITLLSLHLINRSVIMEKDIKRRQEQLASFVTQLDLAKFKMQIKVEEQIH